MEKSDLVYLSAAEALAMFRERALSPVDLLEALIERAERVEPIINAFVDTYFKSKPQILEPIMGVAVEGPGEFQGAFVRSVMQRRGTIIGTTESEGFVRVEAEVPLSEMFGYSTDLRSSTQGKAEYSMEFSKYSPVPAEVSENLIKKYRDENA